MNEAIKNQWVATLRSGRFSQGRGTLADANDNHCCLGVLCEIVPGVEKIEPNPADHFTSPASANVVFEYQGFRDTSYLPKSIAVEYLDGSTNPVISLPDYDGRWNNREHVNLASLNDEGFTFNQIADIVEYFL